MSITSTRTPQSKQNQGYIFKVVLIGDISVGKTNIIKRLIGEEFVQTSATIGVDFSYIHKTIQDGDTTTSINLHLWDTSGAERFRAITISHIRNADAAFIVYDITNRASFESIQYWYDYISMSTNEDIVIYLLGNKNDLDCKRLVTLNEARDSVKKMNISSVYECSAKTNDGIVPIFEAFYNEIYTKNKSKVIASRQEHNKIFEINRKQANGSCC